MSRADTTVEREVGTTGHVSGSCACGKVRYRVSVLPRRSTICHCITCQKIAGGPYIPWIHAPTDKIDWLQQPVTWNCSDLAERGYCASCGSAIYMRYHMDPTITSIAMGTIDESSGRIPSSKEHIFLKDKASWLKLPDDGTARHEKFDAPFQERLNKYEMDQK